MRNELLALERRLDSFLGSGEGQVKIKRVNAIYTGFTLYFHGFRVERSDDLLVAISSDGEFAVYSRGSEIIKGALNELCDADDLIKTINPREIGSAFVDKRYSKYTVEYYESSGTIIITGHNGGGGKDITKWNGKGRKMD